MAKDTLIRQSILIPTQFAAPLPYSSTSLQEGQGLVLCQAKEELLFLEEN